MHSIQVVNERLHSLICGAVSLFCGVMSGSQIAGCDLSNMRVLDVRWESTDISDLHANDISFVKTRLEKSTFFRSSFMRASFRGAVMEAMVLDGLTMIKSLWENTWIENTTMKNLCLQRGNLTGSRFISSSLMDFEALDSRMSNCVFAHCMFSVSYGSGTNGFANADISNCIFYNCLFEGYPLRGANLSANVFAYCSGQIGDEMECTNVAGIGLKGKAKEKALRNEKEARRLAGEYA